MHDSEITISPSITQNTNSEQPEQDLSLSENERKPNEPHTNMLLWACNCGNPDISYEQLSRVFV